MGQHFGNDLRSRRTRNLATRKLDPVLWVKPFEFCPDTPWKQTIGSHAENACEDIQFEVRHAPLRVFKAGYRLSAGVPLSQLEAGRQLSLRPALALAQFAHLRTNHVQLRRLLIDVVTVATAHGQLCRLYLTLFRGFVLDRDWENAKLG